MVLAFAKASVAFALNGAVTMTSKSFLVSCALALGAVSTAVGCSSPTSEPAAASSDDALTSVMDLSEVEGMLNLSKDSKDPSGNWYRGDDKLKAGPCYQKLIAGTGGQDYEFRRYSEGAAFFKKQGAGFASGSDRPLLCLDVDVWYDDGSQKGVNETLEVSGIELDAILRYRLGRPTGGDGAAGTFYSEYQYGNVTTHGGYCPQTGFDPNSADALSLFCFGDISAPGISQGNGGLQLMIYQYAYKHAVRGNAFSMAADPVGRFIRMEGDWNHQVIHFEKLDGIADVKDDGHQTLSIVRKDGLVLASCTRDAVSTNENDFYKVQCTGL
jgi:hypothetical protein